MDHKYFPLFFSLQEKNILFVGGGNIAGRRIEVILPFVEHLNLITKTLTDKLRLLCTAHPEITLEEREFILADLNGRDLVFACTDDAELNGQIAAECKKRGILVNNCSRKEDCDFYFPGIVERGDVVVGVTASGKDHARAKEIKEKIGEALKD